MRPSWVPTQIKPLLSATIDVLVKSRPLCPVIAEKRYFMTSIGKGCDDSDKVVAVAAVDKMMVKNTQTGFTRTFFSPRMYYLSIEKKTKFSSLGRSIIGLKKGNFARVFTKQRNSLTKVLSF